MLALNPLTARQAEQYWKMQDGLWADMEGYSRGWFDRRHEAAETALDVVHQMNGNGADPSAAMRAMADWQQQTMQRLYTDTQQWVELWSRCVRRIVTAEMDAGREALDEVEKRTSSKSPHHATPV